MRYATWAPGQLLAVALVAGAFGSFSAAEQSPHDRLLALIHGDWKSTRTMDGGWPDLSPEGLREMEQQDRATLRAVSGLARKKLDAEDRTLYDVFQWDLTRRVEALRLRLYLTPFSYDSRFDSVSMVNLRVFGQGPPASLSEWRIRLKLAEGYPAYVRQRIALLREALKARMLPSIRLVQQPMLATALAPAAGQRAPAVPVNPYPRFLEVPAEAGSERGSFQAQADAAMREGVIPAIAEFNAVLNAEYVPACPEFARVIDWPNGGDVYAELVRRTTGLNVSPRELHRNAVKEVARIRAEMAALLPKMGLNGTLDEFLAAAPADKQFYFDSANDLLQAYTAAAQRSQAQAPQVVRSVPATPLTVKGGDYSVASMYSASQGRGAPGTVMVDTLRPELRPKFEVMTLMLHEGVPGHHLQISYAREYGAKFVEDPAVRDLLQRPGAFQEGWAVYAETLGDELGLFTDPYDKFGNLTWSLLRAIRVVVDTGIHSEGWTLAQAKKYFAAQTAKPDAVADSEVLRSQSPAGQLTYKVGQEHITAMRQRTAVALGSAFDVRSFHDTLLSWGQLPLGVMERRLDGCLKDSECSKGMKAR